MQELNGYICLDGFIAGSNIYNVLCPGRFNFMWASVGSTITHAGKLRKNAFMAKKLGNTIKSIDNDTLWPDAWKMQIKIKDLTPNNFNTYIDYFINGYGDKTITILNTKESKKINDETADKMVDKMRKDSMEALKKNAEKNAETSVLTNKRRCTSDYW